MTTGNPNWKEVSGFIKTTTVEGLETIMLDVIKAKAHFTDVENDQIANLIKSDNVSRAAARLSAAPTGRVTGYNAVAPLVANATFPEMKKYVHAIDTRIKALPQNQKDVLFATLETGAVNQMLAGLTLPPEGEYYGDDDEAFVGEDPCGELNG